MKEDENDLSNFNLLAEGINVPEAGVTVKNETPSIFSNNNEEEEEESTEETQDEKGSKKPEIPTVKDLDNSESLFGDDEELEEEETEEEETKKPKKKKEVSDELEEDDESEEETSVFKTFATFMDEKGVLDYDPETFDDSEEGLIEMVDKTVKKGIEAYKENIPESAKELLEFLEAGGDPKQFVENKQTFPNYKGITEEMMKKESVHKALVADWMKLEGYSEDEIVETVQDYEDSGLLEKQAKRIKPRLEKKQIEHEEGLLTQAKEHDAEQKKKYKEYIDNIQNSINEREEIAGFALPKKNKEDFFKYITEVGKEGKTRMMQEIEADSDAQLKMAWLMYNKFDFSKIEKKVKTKAVSNLRDKLSNLDVEDKLSGKTKRKKKATDESIFDVDLAKKLL